MMFFSFYYYFDNSAPIDPNQGELRFKQALRFRLLYFSLFTFEITTAIRTDAATCELLAFNGTSLCPVISWPTVLQSSGMNVTGGLFLPCNETIYPGVEFPACDMLRIALFSDQTVSCRAHANVGIEVIQF